MTTVSFDADLDSARAGSDVVTRLGKIFECGDYPDKDFVFTEDDLKNAVSAFQPAPVDLEHIPTVLEGKLGQVARIFASADGKSLMGEVHLPRWLDEALDEGSRKVSATWDRATKTLQGLALVRNPRISDAALMAAFAVAEGEAVFAPKTRHDTATGQYAIQRIHDSAVSGGAVCQVRMASKHEASAVQQAHDLAVEHGASCESASGGPAMYSDPTPTTGNPAAPVPPKHERKRMNILQFLKDMAAEKGVEVNDAELEAAFSGKSSEEVAAIKEAMTAKDKEIESLRDAQKRSEAEFARMAIERRQSEAVTFAKTAIVSKRILPGEAEAALSALYERVSGSDAVATFAEGETRGVELLKALVEKLPDLSVFTTESIKPEESAALFNRTTTPKIDGTDADPARQEKALSATAEGRAILAQRKARQSQS